MKSLTHWGRAIFQTFPNAISWIKMFKFQLIFHWSLFPWGQLTILQHCRLAGAKPLSEPMVVGLQMHICLTQLQWVNQWFLQGCPYQILKMIVAAGFILLIFSCDQAALWMVQSVCLSVTPFSLCSHHRIIMKFSGVITNDKSDVHAKGQGQMSKVKVTEVTNQLNRFRTVTPVWIHIWWNDAHSLVLLRRGALLFFKVIRQISRSHGSNNRRIWPRLGVSGL